MNKKLAYGLAMPFLLLAGALMLFFLKRNSQNANTDC